MIELEAEPGAVWKRLLSTTTLIMAACHQTSWIKSYRVEKIKVPKCQICTKINIVWLIKHGPGSYSDIKQRNMTINTIGRMFAAEICVKSLIADIPISQPFFILVHLKVPVNLWALITFRDDRVRGWTGCRLKALVEYNNFDYGSLSPNLVDQKL